jgi:outer membrane protein assembly factor BamB
LRVGVPKKRMVSAVISGSLAVALAIAGPPANADITTVSVDSLRSGWDSNEPNLSPSWVTASDFGKQFATQLNGQIYAQPIVAGGTLIVATENNQVYGLDPTTGTQKWQRSLGAPWPAATLSCGDLTPNIGITSTPAYDPDTGAVYLTTKVNDGADAAHPHWSLHALNDVISASFMGFDRARSG